MTAAPSAAQVSAAQVSAAQVSAARLDGRRDELGRAAEAARAVAEHLSTLASGAARAADGLPDVTGWQGRTAVAATSGLGRRQGSLEQVAAAFGAAAGAAREHATALQSAVAQLGPVAPTGITSDATALARAEQIADESDRRCAAALGALAAAAPPRRSRWRQGLDTLESWRAHFEAGVVESTAGLGMLALSAAAVPVGLRRQDDVLDPGDLIDVLRDPEGLARGVLDWDTWRDDPARAAGHLVPDAVAAALGGSAAAAARSRQITKLGEKASARAAYRQQSILGARRAGAEGARQRLITSSLDQGTRQALDPGSGASSGWRQGGSRLDRLSNAQVEVFHRLNAAGEPALTEQVKAVSRQVDARLDHLETRLKSVDSLKRKVADFRKGTIAERLARADDVVRYTLVFEGPAYTAGAHRAAALLTASGLHLDRIWQAWDIAKVPYRGINSFWVDPRTGVKVELQFHTPDSHRASIETHPQYEEKRAAGTGQARRDELDGEMFEVFKRAEPPPGVLSIEQKVLIPQPPPDWFAPPPDHRLAMAVLSGAAVGSLQTPRNAT